MGRLFGREVPAGDSGLRTLLGWVEHGDRHFARHLEQLAGPVARLENHQHAPIAAAAVVTAPPVSCLLRTMRSTRAGR